MKLSVKLGSTIGIILAAFCGFGLFSLSQMAAINAQSTQLSTRSIPVLIAAQDINAITAKMRTLAIRHVYTEDSSTMGKLEKQMEDLEAKYRESVGVVREIATTPVIKDQLHQVELKHRDYLTAREKMTSFSRQNELDKAILLYNGQTKTASEALEAEVDKLVDLIVARTKVIDEQGDANYARARTITVIVLVAIFLLGAALGGVLVRGVLKQLGKDPGALAAIARRVAGGDYAVADGSREIGVYGNIVDMVKALEKQIKMANEESERAARESENAKAAMQQAEEARKAAAPGGKACWMRPAGLSR